MFFYRSATSWYDWLQTTTEPTYLFFLLQICGRPSFFLFSWHSAIFSSPLQKMNDHHRDHLKDWESYRVDLCAGESVVLQRENSPMLINYLGSDSTPAPVSTSLLRIDYTCVLDVQFGCAFSLSHAFFMSFLVLKTQKWHQNAFDSETHIQTAHQNASVIDPLQSKLSAWQLSHRDWWIPNIGAVKSCLEATRNKR
jgi:hypothetical protein